MWIIAKLVKGESSEWRLSCVCCSEAIETTQRTRCAVCKLNMHIDCGDEQEKADSSGSIKGRVCVNGGGASTSAPERRTSELAASGALVLGDLKKDVIRVVSLLQ